MLTALFAALIALAPASARAHAIVVAASPAANARIAPGKVHVRLRFNSRIDVDRSRLTLQAPDGSDHPLALARGEPPGVLAGEAMLTIAGQWTLHWQVLSVDGHITRGDITYRVGEGKTGP